jgi:rhodanese-related sulfurtransferase
MKLQILKKVRIKLLFLFISLILFGCLKDPQPTEMDYNLSHSALLLHHIEENWDYLNNYAPSTISALSLFSSLNYFIVLDVRSKEKFDIGRIPNSINVKQDNLIFYFEQNLTDSTKAVIVSESGQLSGYLTCLLRIKGYRNVYSLNFGIASWHTDFANEIFAERSLISSEINTEMTNTNYAKHDFQPLPELKFENPQDIQKNLCDRINLVSDDIFLSNNLIIENKIPVLICYGNFSLYNAHPTEGEDAGRGHPEDAIHYNHNVFEGISDLRSSNYLQTIPPDQYILIYSYSGQLSAFATAYLRILGYNAYSLKYGGSLFSYSRLLSNNNTSRYIFDESKIMNYAYEK